jgi:2-C-methyl-D-erythritol 4-phosphate cytidylyltransferase
MNQKNALVLLLAGSGSRIYKDIKMKKQFYPVLGKELFLYSLEASVESGIFSRIVLVIDKEDKEQVKSIVEKNIKGDVLISYATGGKDRNESVYHGLSSLKPVEKDEIVFIHDAARPLLTKEILSSLLEGMKNHEALTTVVPVHDSLLKEVDGKITYVDRKDMYQIQTPQVFLLDKILSLYENGYDPSDTDDFKKAVKANLVCGLVRGSQNLFKITEIDDLRLLENILTSAQ